MSSNRGSVSRRTRRAVRLAVAVITISVVSLFSVAASGAAKGAHWSLLTSPNVQSAPGLSAISCAKPDYCMAVGDNYGELWNGHSWHISRPPIASDGDPAQPNHENELAGVSCPTVSFCVAVGTPEVQNQTGPPLMERWNGKVWSIMAAPVTAGAKLLSGITCASPHDCLAVGSTEVVQCPSVSATATGSSYVSYAWDGHVWQELTTPDKDTCGTGAEPGYTDQLRAVSCGATDFCVAVGYAQPTGNSQGTPSAELWDGHAWTPSLAPALGTIGGFQGVSCVGSNYCMASGASPFNAPTTDISVVYTDGNWNAVPGYATPADGSTVATDVDCLSTKSCVETGNDTLGGDASITPWVRSWNGSSWSTTNGSSQEGDSLLSSLSCTSASRCLAVGEAESGAVDPTGDFSLSYDGRHLRPLQAPAPPTVFDNRFAAVDCATASVCMAVGSFTAAGLDAPDVDRIHDGVSNPTRIGIVTGTGDNVRLLAVSCENKANCVGVGTDRDGVNTQGVVAIDQSNRWDGVVLPDPGTTLRGVTCASRIHCVIVGQQLNGMAQPQARIVDFSEATGLSAVTTPKPGGPDSSLAAISCANVNHCVAVGYRRPSAGHNRTLIESWNGHHWSVARSANVSGASDELLGVSCSSTGRCVAVGTVTKHSVVTPLVEAPHRGVWKIVPGIHRLKSGELNAVSCVTAGCTAVGSRPVGSNGRTLIAGVSSSSWSAVASPNRGSDGDTLDGVSCVGRHCTAVGSYLKGHHVQTLLESI
jgi:hypothetical protein